MIKNEMYPFHDFYDPDQQIFLFNAAQPDAGRVHVIVGIWFFLAAKSLCTDEYP